MTAKRVTVRVDATYGPTVKVADKVRQGDRLCDADPAQASCVCPVWGVVEDVHFDPERHEFVISIVPTATD